MPKYLKGLNQAVSVASRVHPGPVAYAPGISFYTTVQQMPLGDVGTL